MMSMTLDEVEETLKRGRVTGASSADEATAAVLAKVKQSIAASRKEAMANPKPRFAIAGLMPQQTRVLLGTLGLSVTGTHAQIYARLRDVAKEDATERCPVLFQSVWAVSDNANRVVEALPGCAGVRWRIALPLGLASIDAAAWVHMPLVTKQADVAGGDVEVGIEVSQQIFTHTIKLSEIKKSMGEGKQVVSSCYHISVHMR